MHHIKSLFAVWEYGLLHAVTHIGGGWTHSLGSDQVLGWKSPASEPATLPHPWVVPNKSSPCHVAKVRFMGMFSLGWSACQMGSRAGLARMACSMTPVAETWGSKIWGGRAPQLPNPSDWNSEWQTGHHLSHNWGVLFISGDRDECLCHMCMSGSENRTAFHSILFHFTHVKGLKCFHSISQNLPLKHFEVLRNILRTFVLPGN